MYFSGTTTVCRAAKESRSHQQYRALFSLTTIWQSLKSLYGKNRASKVILHEEDSSSVEPFFSSDVISIVDALDIGNSAVKFMFRKVLQSHQLKHQCGITSLAMLVGLLSSSAQHLLSRGYDSELIIIHFRTYGEICSRLCSQQISTVPSFILPTTALIFPVNYKSPSFLAWQNQSTPIEFLFVLWCRLYNELATLLKLQIKATQAFQPMRNSGTPLRVGSVAILIGLKQQHMNWTLVQIVALPTVDCQKASSRYNIDQFCFHFRSNLLTIVNIIIDRVRSILINCI